MLKLIRPLSFFDLETTGKDTAKDRIVEIAIKRLYPNGTTDTLVLRVNPMVDIPAEATAVHGITNEMVADKPEFKQVASEIAEFLNDTDFATFNGNRFDIPLLVAEFTRASEPFNLTGVNFIDVKVLFNEVAPRTLSAAHKQYIGFEFDGSHEALADVEATERVFFEMLKQHQEGGTVLPLDIEQLALKSNYGKHRIDIDGKFVYNSMGVAVFSFGKHKDQPVFKEKPYLQWMLDAKDKETGLPVFSHDTRNAIGLFLKGDKTTNHPSSTHQVFKRY